MTVAAEHKTVQILHRIVLDICNTKSLITHVVDVINDACIQLSL